MAEPSSSSGIRNPTPLAPVLLVNFIGTMGFTIVIPFLVFLVTRFGGNALVYGLVAADPAGERALAATEAGDELYSPTSFL